MELERAIVIVVGAHHEAEQHDRPIAYGLRDRMAGWLRSRGVDAPVLVCTDLWHLNTRTLRGRPTVSIGGPEVNALAAYLGDKLPSAFAIEGRLVVQMDVELADLVASCWGATTEGTRAAVEAFCEKYLERFMEAAVK